MGCNASNTKPTAILKAKHLDSQTPIDTAAKLTIHPGQFIFHKTWSILQDYEFGPVLGSGAFGCVRTAVHKATNQERAIKSIKKEGITKDMLEKSRFLTEIDILRQIDHPNIVRLYEFYEDKKSYHLVTEIVKGGELFEFIVSSGMLTEKIAAHFLKQIFWAVNYCHKNGIVHRDLKPENLLLEKRSPTANLKVIDFGASGLYTGEGALQKRFGTAYYIAPEVLRRNYNEKCDIWSCGVIMYILLSGKPPFSGKNDSEIMEKVKKGQYSLNGPEWENVSKTAKDLLSNLLQIHPNLRYSAEQALAHPWFTIHHEDQPLKITQSVINELKSFRATEKLQHAVLTFIASQMSSKEEANQLANTFKAIDTNGDGKLSAEELFEEMKKTMSPEEAKEEVDRILDGVDMDQNGYIDYSEFLIATMKKESLISRKNLEAAFVMFDRDGSGAISAQEIKSVLAVNVSSLDEVWEKIISSVDQNGDGQIDLKEFKDMMLKLFN